MAYHAHNTRTATRAFVDAIPVASPLIVAVGVGLSVLVATAIHTVTNNPSVAFSKAQRSEDLTNSFVRVAVAVGHTLTRSTDKRSRGCCRPQAWRPRAAAILAFALHGRRRSVFCTRAPTPSVHDSLLRDLHAGNLDQSAPLALGPEKALFKYWKSWKSGTPTSTHQPIA